MRASWGVPKALCRQHASADQALRAGSPRQLPVQLDLYEVSAQAAGDERGARNVDTLAHERGDGRADGEVVMESDEGASEARGVQERVEGQRAEDMACPGT